ncbi:MAG: alpha/beta fold hydrolase, partial [Cyanobacteria bacterium P01_D01_bin.56]
MWLRNLILLCTTAYQIWCCRQEDQTPPPGKIYDIGDCKLHLYRRGRSRRNEPTVVLDHSLGGVEGYLLIDDIAEFADVCIYDRAGYGWSSNSPNPRNSGEMVQELEALLRQAEIPPPYILVGDSLGSYTMRLYAHTYPENVAGLVLTDGLHED